MGFGVNETICPEKIAELSLYFFVFSKTLLSTIMQIFDNLNHVLESQKQNLNPSACRIFTLKVIIPPRNTYG